MYIHCTCILHCIRTVVHIQYYTLFWHLHKVCCWNDKEQHGWSHNKPDVDGLHTNNARKWISHTVDTHTCTCTCNIIRQHYTCSVHVHVLCLWNICSLIQTGQRSIEIHCIYMYSCTCTYTMYTYNIHVHACTCTLMYSVHAVYNIYMYTVKLCIMYMYM